MLTGGYHPQGLATGKLPLLSSRLDTLLPHTLHILAEQGTELVQHLLSPELLIEGRAHYAAHFPTISYPS